MVRSYYNLNSFHLQQSAALMCKLCPRGHDLTIERSEKHGRSGPFYKIGPTFTRTLISVACVRSRRDLGRV